MQRIDDRIAAGPVFRIAGRQEHEDVPVGAVAFKVAFEGRAVNLDALHGDWLRSLNHRRHFGLYLREAQTRAGQHQRNHGPTGAEHSASQHRLLP